MARQKERLRGITYFLAAVFLLPLLLLREFRVKDEAENYD